MSLLIDFLLTNFFLSKCPNYGKGGGQGILPHVQNFVVFFFLKAPLVKRSRFCSIQILCRPWVKQDSVWIDMSPLHTQQNSPTDHQAMWQNNPGSRLGHGCGCYAGYNTDWTHKSHKNIQPYVERPKEPLNVLWPHQSKIGSKLLTVPWNEISYYSGYPFSNCNHYNNFFKKIYRNFVYVVYFALCS